MYTRPVMGIRNMGDNWTMVRLRPETHEQLKAIKRDGESHNDCLKRSLELLETLGNIEEP